MALIPFFEAKTYLRVASSDEDALIGMLGHDERDILEHLKAEQVKAGGIFIVLPHAGFQLTEVFVDIPAKLDAVHTGNRCACAELHFLTIDLDFLRNCHSRFPPEM